MKSIENVTYFPEKLTKDSLVIINYFGNLNNTNQNLYIEYSYDKIPTDINSIRKAQMSKVTDYSFVLVALEDANTIYFRFVDEYGTFDNNGGNFYQKAIEQTSEKTYLEPTALLDEYKKSNNNSHIIENSTENLSEIKPDEEYKPIENTMALVPIKERDLVYARKGLRFSYKLNKRIKLLLIKLFRSLPSFLTGNYRRRINL